VNGHPFSEAEVAILRSHGFVLFANRVIFEAQPPIDPAVLTDVASHCEGPIPAELLDLWNLTAGGSLDYELTVSMDGQAEVVSWIELFYSKSRKYRTLEGWLENQIEFEEELHSADPGAWSGKASLLPIGGFEYCDRIYVNITPGEGYGGVVAWKMGLPPAWKHRLHQDSSALVAPSLHEAFSEVHLSADPRTTTEKSAKGLDFIEYVDVRRNEHSLDTQLADRLVDYFVASALLQWQPFLADGTLRDHPHRLSVAIRQAIQTDDAALIHAIAALGETFDQPLQGSALPIVVSLHADAFAVVAALLEAGAPVDKYALTEVTGVIPLALAKALLDKGAYASGEATVHSAERGAFDSARHIAQSIHPGEPSLCMLSVNDAQEAALQKLRTSLENVRVNGWVHYLGEEGLETRIRNIEEFTL
jgi:hypothetical protein